MTVTFFSNFLNHHQLPFCLSLINSFDIKFTFVATQPTPIERLQMGYQDMNEMYDFCVCSYKSNHNLLQAKKLANESDIVIIGSAPNYLFYERIMNKKITFRVSERMFKRGIVDLLSPKIIKRTYQNFIVNRKTVNILCASAYLGGDLKKFTSDIKMFKWGYFPKFIEKDTAELLRKKNQNHIIWVGRFLKWKNPIVAIKLAKYLSEKNIPFSLEFIGDGPEKQKMERMISDFGLKNLVTIHPFLPFDKVRDKMDEASIYLFTSNFFEGWGAVLNEAMNSGCIPVCSHSAGSVPYLIRNKYNGFIYNLRKPKTLYLIVENLLSGKYDSREVANNAYSTIANVWNSDNATSNFLLLCDNILNGKNHTIIGPCEIEEGIPQRKMLKKLIKESETQDK